MQTIPLQHLIQLKSQPASDAVFVISSDKSDFIHVDKKNVYSPENIRFYACPTQLCGDAADLYSSHFAMAVLSITPFADQLETLNGTSLPKVLFVTHTDIRRSMTLNAMRMCTELFALGSQRVFQLAKQRLEANQSDVVHDLLVYLMHAILDARREYERETTLRAESIAAYLGIVPAKVLILVRQNNDANQLTENLRDGYAGKLQRELNVGALVDNQLALLTPYQKVAIEKETQVLQMIRRILELWKAY